MTIGKLASAAAVPVSTVRFYERAGLLKPDGRSNGNYREYDAASLERLRFIRAAAAVGLSVKDVSELLKLTREDGSPCRNIEVLLQRRLADIRGRMKELRRVERKLVKSLETCCRSGGDPGICERVHRLGGKKISDCP